MARKSKAKQHTRDLVAGMRSSNSQSRTPISTLYPKKVTVGTSKTSPSARSKGTHSPSKSRSPQKFLLSVTNPGDRPIAPTEPKAPAVVKGPGKLGPVESYKGYDKAAKGFSKTKAGDIGKALRAQHQEANEAQTTAFQSYQANQASYTKNLSTWNASMNVYNNTTLPNWNRSNDAYTSNTSKNTKISKGYNRDAAKFLNSLRSKSNKVSPKIAAKMRGSRNNNTRLGGARS